jgi:isoleucyl-tRNA synthetase
VASDGGETVAFEVAITPELRREGLAREVIRLVQDARKSDGLDVSDRIWLRWQTTDSELAAALAEHGALISAEVLAADGQSLPPGGQAEGAREHVDEVLALTFWIRRAPASSG